MDQLADSGAVDIIHVGEVQAESVAIGNPSKLRIVLPQQRRFHTQNDTPAQIHDGHYTRIRVCCVKRQSAHSIFLLGAASCPAALTAQAVACTTPQATSWT